MLLSVDCNHIKVISLCAEKVSEKEGSLQENTYTNEAYSLSLKDGNSVNKSPFLLTNQVQP